MNFTLRPWRKTDIDSLIEHANNINIANNLTDKFPHPYTKDDGLSYLEFVTGESTAIILAIDIDGEAAGSIGLFPQDDVHRKNAELGYWLGETYWGKGIVTAAIQEVVAIGFEKLDISRIFARPFGSNVGSQRVLEKAGFKLEATLRQIIIKNNQFEDELIYGIRK